MTKSMLKRLFRSLAFRIVIAVVILYTVYHCVAALSDRVVTDVITVRLRLSLSALLQSSPKSVFWSLRRSSRMRSNTTIVSFTE